MSNQVRYHRQLRNWSQAELADRSGVPRSTVAAVEQERLSPSVQTALALAEALGCTVEELFPQRETKPPDWAWPPVKVPCGFWKASVNHRVCSYPAEPSTLALFSPDGWYDEREHFFARPDPSRSIVLASCDPTHGLLAGLVYSRTGFRLLAFPRNSREALRLLAEGRIHVAGVHLASSRRSEGNIAAVRGDLGSGYRLLRVACWTEGVALHPDRRSTAEPPWRDESLRWVTREPGSGARQCQDQLPDGPKQFAGPAFDHWEVARLIRQGWADAGICHQFAADQYGLEFFPLRQEVFEFCFPETWIEDPREQALEEAVRSLEYRKSLGRLPGFDVTESGEVHTT